MTPGEALGHARAALGQATSGSTRSIGTGEALEVGQVLEAALQALADVRTLDGWLANETLDRPRYQQLDRMAAIGDAWICNLFEVVEGLHENRGHGKASTPDEARAKAAAWVRGLK